MKRNMAPALTALALCASLFAACGAEKPDANATASVTTSETAAKTSGTTAGDATAAASAPEKPRAAAYTLGEQTDNGTVVYFNDFENDLDGFYARRSGGDDAPLELSRDTAYSGVTSLKCGGRTSQADGMNLDATYLIRKNVKHYVSVWVSHDGGAPMDIYLSRQQTDASGNETYEQLTGDGDSSRSRARGVKPGEWAQIVGWFTWQDFSKLVIYVEGNYQTSDKTTFYIDDFLIERSNEKGFAIPDLPSIMSNRIGFYDLGTAAGADDLSGERLTFVLQNFNAITPENAFKPSSLSTAKDTYDFARADELLALADAAGLKFNAHTLVWHEQSAAWLNSDDLTKEQAKANLNSYIENVAGHFAGKVYSWDVVNEALSDNIPPSTAWTGALRQDAPWFKKLGSDYIEQAFAAAAKADPNAKLFYNDYNLDFPDKANAAYGMIKSLLSKGVRVDGIGMQGHYGISTDSANVERSIELFSALRELNPDFVICISELDVTVGGADAKKGLTEEQEKLQATKYAELFRIFDRHKDVIGRVTLWGYEDPRSWRSEKFPLVWGEGLAVKEAYYAVVDPVKYLGE